jgi:hypothetical protein
MHAGLHLQRTPSTVGDALTEGVGRQLRLALVHRLQERVTPPEEVKSIAGQPALRGAGPADQYVQEE